MNSTISKLELLRENIYMNSVLRQEHISHLPEDDGAWVCLCQNEPADEGFYPVNRQNVIVDPVAELWDCTNYVCSRCGRIINMNTLEVVARVHPNTLVFPEGA